MSTQIILTAICSSIIIAATTSLNQYVLLDVHLTELLWLRALVIRIIIVRRRVRLGTDLGLSAEGVQFETAELGSHTEFLFLLSVASIFDTTAI